MSAGPLVQDPSVCSRWDVGRSHAALSWGTRGSAVPPRSLGWQQSRVTPRRTQTAAPVSKLGFTAALVSADRQNRKRLAVFTAQPATVPAINLTTGLEAHFG